MSALGQKHGPLMRPHKPFMLFYVPSLFALSDLVKLLSIATLYITVVRRVRVGECFFLNVITAMSLYSCIAIKSMQSVPNSSITHQFRIPILGQLEHRMHCDKGRWSFFFLSVCTVCINWKEFSQYCEWIISQTYI